MRAHARTTNEQAASRAFDRQAPLFDGLYNLDTIVRYKRQRVRDHLLRYLNPHSHILELNAGTGEDAVFLATQGHSIHATDISEGMQRMLVRKVKQWGLQERVTHERCSYTDLERLKNKGPYDLIFSNFAGLNCTGELAKVLDALPSLLKPGGMVTLVLLPGFCLWEFLLLFKGKWKTATRRLFSRHGVDAHIEGVFFKCWYYRPSWVVRQMEQHFYLLGTEGLCTIVPPSYIEEFAEKHPRLFDFLQREEGRRKAKWPWKFIGDYMILSFIKKD